MMVLQGHIVLAFMEKTKEMINDMHATEKKTIII